MKTTNFSKIQLAKMYLDIFSYLWINGKIGLSDKLDIIFSSFVDVEKDFSDEERKELEKYQDIIYNQLEK